MSTLHERLAKERHRLGMNQTTFALAGGAGRASQANYESGKRFPDAAYLAAIAKIGVDVQYILTGHRSDLTADVAECCPTVERISVVLDENHVDIRDAAYGCGIKFARFEQMMAGEIPVSADVLQALHREYGVDVTWLITGEGRMHGVPPELLEKRVRALPENNKSKEAGVLSPRDQAWLDLAQHLPDDQRTRLQEIGDALVSATHCHEKKDVS